MNEEKQGIVKKEIKRFTFLDFINGLQGTVKIDLGGNAKPIHIAQWQEMPQNEEGDNYMLRGGIHYFRGVVEFTAYLKGNLFHGDCCCTGRIIIDQSEPA